MRKFAHKCNADNPERLRGTLLIVRKQIATNCHKLKLTQQEVSKLADFMGTKKICNTINYFEKKLISSLSVNI